MITVTGKTNNYLDLARTYDPNNPYVVGVNGVTAYVPDEYIEYNVDGIIFYRTLFDDDLTTTFSCTGATINYDDTLIVGDESNSFAANSSIESFINIDRNNYSIFENFYKLSQINNLSDLDDLPLNYL